jgi:hypothetical protein
MDRLHSMRVFARWSTRQLCERCAQPERLGGGRDAARRRSRGAPRCALLNRTTRRLSLTDTGEAYLERVRHVLTEIDEAEALASASTAEPRGHLRVLCPPRSRSTSSPST